ncbi:MAG: sugar phosphate isomerase/epimerase [Gammaproteobacteria bacterium]|nr:sugar phosphate isomerase/epimerase [Gammaproteobacteria bacterium]
MTINITLHSFSLVQHFQYKNGFDVFSFIELADRLKFSGVSLSLVGANYRHLGSKDTDHMERVCAAIADHSLSLDVETAGTKPSHLKQLISVAKQLRSPSLRTFTHHSGSKNQMIARTIADLAQVVEEAASAGVVLLLENHEDFTGLEMIEIVQAVNHPSLKILFDYGNSQMLLEDPEAALEAMLPHIYSVHVKDHALVEAKNSEVGWVIGVPVGDGTLPIQSLTNTLLAHGIKRFSFENSWAYKAPIRSGEEPKGEVVLGQNSFRWVAPPFDDRSLCIEPGALDPNTLVEYEYSALLRGWESFKTMVANLDLG